MDKVGLLEYADLLKAWGVDFQITCIYDFQTQVLKHFLNDKELLDLEETILSYCYLTRAMREENEEYPYAWLMEPFSASADDFGNRWKQLIVGIPRIGLRAELKVRKRWHLESTCAACLLVVSYAESIQAGKLQRDDALTRAAVMQDLAFLLNDAAFWGSSAPEIEKQKVKRRRRKGAVESAAKSFKARFRNEVVSPEYQKILKKGLQRGDKAKFIRKMVQAYADFFDEAVNNGAALSERDEFITEETIKRWISEIDNEMKSSA